ncbi:MAG: arylesterase [Cellvibrionaceae bacterium]
MSRNIVVLGDSISAAYGINKNEGWVTLLERKLADEGYSDYKVINASISGNTTGDGLSRLPLLLSEYRPEIVLVELGGNDGLRGYPIKLMENNLLQIIEKSKTVGSKILLAGIEIPPNYGKRYTEAFSKAYKNVAKKSDVIFLPFILEGVATNPQLMQKDGIHPTTEAQTILLSNIWPYLKELLKR